VLVPRSEELCDPSVEQLAVISPRQAAIAAERSGNLGLYWKRVTTQGALYAIIAGLTSWLVLELLSQPTDIWPPQLIGFLMAGIGMLVGSLWPSQVCESRKTNGRVTGE
jgi:hypothetical protein